jgi:hypothetical protein
MTERTVTEQQVINAMNKRAPSKDMIIINQIFDELFPELPKLGELILAWDNNQPELPGWYEFSEFADGNIGVINYDGDRLYFDNYRRQTPAERGEG